MTDITEFENNFDDLLQKPASNNISETLSNVDVSNPFQDAVSLLIAPISPLTDVNGNGTHDLYIEPPLNNPLNDSLISSEPEVQSIEIRFDEERDYEEVDVSSFNGIDAISISSEGHVHEISNSDESFDEESIIGKESHVHQDESKGVLKSLGEAVSNATTFSKFVETDENRKNQLDILDFQLKALLKSVETVVKQRKANNLMTLGNLQRNIKELHEKQIYQTWQNAVYDLQKKKATYERLKIQGKMNQDKLSIMLAQIAESEHRVEDCKHEFEDVSKLIKAELDRFDKEKVEDFKNSVEAFLESMVQTQKE
ncbi:8123_t:CDS:2, partial [Racocetra fulgida]